MAYWKIIKKEEEGALHSIQAVWTSGHGESVVRRVNPISPIFFHNQSSVDPAIHMLKRSKKHAILPIDAYLYVPMGVVKIFSSSYDFALYFKMHWQGSDVSNKIIFTNQGTYASELLKSKCVSNYKMPRCLSDHKVDPECIIRYVFSTAAADINSHTKMCNSIKERLVFDEHKQLGEITSPFGATSFVEAMGGKDFIKTHKELSLMLNLRQRTPLSQANPLTQIIDKDSRYRVEGLTGTSPKEDLFKTVKSKKIEIMSEEERKQLREGSLFGGSNATEKLNSSNTKSLILTHRLVQKDCPTVVITAYCLNKNKYLITMLYPEYNLSIPMRTQKNTIELFNLIKNNWRKVSSSPLDEYSRRSVYLSFTSRMGEKESKLLFEGKKNEADLFMDEWEGTNFKLNLVTSLNSDPSFIIAEEEDVEWAIVSCSKTAPLAINISEA
ncbi:hypothetical protein [Photobacterium kishitanii]|uniref:Uncharacterized protein n=1 Tax=Photobacterium kishitanii TaxID=318456 RepID=A0A2T3KMJ1_9GAMM|nr:hypothetical protein [Photobacterium kishitanii]PSV01016.1 hypothetical protein C9J27_03030 [Photobacterium kishitanii]